MADDDKPKITTNQFLARACWILAAIALVCAVIHGNTLPTDAHTYLRSSHAELHALSIEQDVETFRVVMVAWGFAVLALLFTISGKLDRPQSPTGRVDG